MAGRLRKGLAKGPGFGRVKIDTLRGSNSLAKTQKKLSTKMSLVRVSAVDRDISSGEKIVRCENVVFFPLWHFLGERKRYKF